MPAAFRHNKSLFSYLSVYLVNIPRSTKIELSQIEISSLLLKFVAKCFVIIQWTCSKFVGLPCMLKFTSLKFPRFCRASLFFLAALYPGSCRTIILTRHCFVVVLILLFCHRITRFIMCENNYWDRRGGVITQLICLLRCLSPSVLGYGEIFHIGLASSHNQLQHLFLKDICHLRCVSFVTPLAVGLCWAIFVCLYKFCTVIQFWVV